MLFCAVYSISIKFSLFQVCLPFAEHGSNIPKSCTGIQVSLRDRHGRLSKAFSHLPSNTDFCWVRNHTRVSFGRRCRGSDRKEVPVNVEAPYLVKKIAGVDYVYFTQKNSLDRRKRTLLIEASNISFASRIVVIEKCNYYNSEWTCFEQNASLDVKSFFGFESSVEKLAVKQYAANLAKGKEILEYFIEELLKSGLTYIPPYNGPENCGDMASLTDSAIDMAKPSCEENSNGSELTATEVSTMANGLTPGTNAGTPEPGQLRRTSAVSEGHSAGFVRASSMDDQ
ncbi:hypothetical protein L596_003925 [Steinernema carpocapsae]|uniref:PRELI/MSF1 domain-containing protein n=1 Tax=Steinernema carpocapsae TaxID=34508 RepID=A0A4U8UU87_STECR|nr:hypothetical protein L596_003925 [Steinernema carpocapsae]